MKLTAERKARLIELSAVQAPIKEIAKELGVSITWVNNWQLALMLKPTPSEGVTFVRKQDCGRPQKQIDPIALSEALNASMSVQEIQEKFSVSRRIALREIEKIGFTLPDKYAPIKQYHDDGLNVSEIQALTGISRQNIRYHLRKMGLNPLKAPSILDKLYAEQGDKIIDLFLKGHKFQDLAKLWGVAPFYVSKIFERAGGKALKERYSTKYLKSQNSSPR
jgi:transposase-like protein